MHIGHVLPLKAYPQFLMSNICFLTMFRMEPWYPLRYPPGKPEASYFLGFATLVQCFRCHWVHFVKEAFSDLCPEISSSKIGGQFGLAPLKAFSVHLNSGCKTALWTIFIQLNLCDRMSTRAWKPD
jgi:hypothetical protein